MTERAGEGRNVVVVGASAGGVEALSKLVAALPADFSAAMFVVLHVPSSGSVLPQILARSGPLGSRHAVDGDEIDNGCVFVAPPDYHLLLDTDEMRVVRGPKENGHRPAIDPLFRTAAATHGVSVTGVILSGSLDDGTAGLEAVKRAGGATIVQDPDEALYRAMPTSAIHGVNPDHVLRVAEIARLLSENHDRPSGGRRLAVARTGEETAMTAESDPTQLDPVALAEENDRVGRVSSYTCPECNGALWEFEEGQVVKLRCRVGHTYTEEGYEREKAVALEAALWSAMTALVEKADFSARLSARFRRSGHDKTAARYEHQSSESLEHAERVRQALMALGAPIAAEEPAHAS